MGRMLIELRMCIAEKLLSWAWDIAPINKQGTVLKNTVWGYFYRLKTK